MTHDRWPHEEELQAPAVDKAKPEPFWDRWRKPLSDEEYVEKVRRGTGTMNRWKPYFVAFHLGMVGFIILLIDWAVGLITDMLNLPGQVGANPNIGRNLVLIGIGLGAGLGLQLSHSMAALFRLLRGDRDLDLLVKYYDLTHQQPIIEHST
jgi:hypothetical protein